MYNAVVGIEGRFSPYKWHGRGPGTASSEAAAAGAAHRVLRTYFPKPGNRIDAALAASLARIPDGRAEDLGVAFGRKAADHLVRQRVDDGRRAPVSFGRQPAMGVWRPTPPANQAFHLPWLAKMRPLLVESPDQFLPGPPPPPHSRRYARDVAEVKAMGGKNSRQRSARQTETARF